MSEYGTPITYADGLDESSWRALPEGDRCECSECNWRGHVNDLSWINDIHDRISEGEPMAAGTCPECVALVRSVECENMFAREHDKEQARTALLRDCLRLLNDARRFRTRDSSIDSYRVAARLSAFLKDNPHG